MRGSASPGRRPEAPNNHRARDALTDPGHGVEVGLEGIRPSDCLSQLSSRPPDFPSFTRVAGGGGLSDLSGGAVLFSQIKCE